MWPRDWHAQSPCRARRRKSMPVRLRAQNGYLSPRAEPDVDREASLALCNRQAPVALLRLLDVSRRAGAHLPGDHARQAGGLAPVGRVPLSGGAARALLQVGQPFGRAPGGRKLGQRLREGRGPIRHRNRLLSPWHSNSRHPAINDRPGMVLSALPCGMVHPRRVGNLRREGVLEAAYVVLALMNLTYHCPSRCRIASRT